MIVYCFRFCEKKTSETLSVVNKALLYVATMTEKVSPTMRWFYILGQQQGGNNINSFN